MECLKQIQNVPGQAGFYYCPLDGELVEYQSDLPLVAASVIKIPVMVAAFKAFDEGVLNPDDEVVVRPEDKKPSCGALTYLHDGLKVTLMDLVTLMIILSDNTATNMMIDRIGIGRVNEIMNELGIPGIALRRKLFDAEKARQGIENTVTARGVGLILTRLARSELLGEEADQKMIGILLNQRLNGKLSFYLHSLNVRIAHKTGEDDGITHDVGIVYGKRPFVICMLSNQVNVPKFERLIQDAALELYEMNER